MVSRKVFALGMKVKILVHLEIGIVSHVSETLKLRSSILHFRILRNTSPG